MQDIHQVKREKCSWGYCFLSYYIFGFLGTKLGKDMSIWCVPASFRSSREILPWLLSLEVFSLLCWQEKTQKTVSVILPGSSQLHRKLTWVLFFAYCTFKFRAKKKLLTTNNYLLAGPRTDIRLLNYFHFYQLYLWRSYYSFSVFEELASVLAFISISNDWWEQCSYIHSLWMG